MWNFYSLDFVDRFSAMATETVLNEIKFLNRINSGYR